MATHDHSEASQTAATAEPRAMREVRFEYSPHFPRILEHLGAAARVDLPGRQVGGDRHARRAAHVLVPQLRQGHGRGGRPAADCRGQPAGDPLPPPGPRAGSGGRTGRRVRLLLVDSRQSSHGKYPRPRTGVGQRRAVGGQHPVLLPLHAARQVQLRSPLAAAVCERTDRAGPLPLERRGHAGRSAALRDGSRSV